MGFRQTGSRLAHAGTRYLLETDPGALIYRNGVSTTNLQQRQWTDSKASDANGAVTFTIPTGLFTTIHFIDLNVMRDTADARFGTFCMLRSFTLTSAVAQCFESRTSGVLLGGTTEGLETATSSLIVMVRVTGI